MRFEALSSDDKKLILDTLKVQSFEDLLSDIPGHLRNQDVWDKKGLSEIEIQRKYFQTGQKNINLSQVQCYLGGGAYDHYIPSVVDDICSKPEFSTSYTPYQPECSQGMLQAMFEFQTMICRLTEMDVTTCSHYDGATALIEVIRLALMKKKGKILFSSFLSPFYKEVIKTYFNSDFNEIFHELVPASGVIEQELLNDHSDVSALIVSSPNFLGHIEDTKSLADHVHSKKALLINCVNPLSLGLLESPGSQGADLVVGEGQPLGIPLSYGGPYLGFISTKKEFIRKLPGRIVGQALDSDGQPGFVLTMQAREQHIRREKALSNICSNQALCALRATVYLSYLGPHGLKNISLECFEKAHFLEHRLIQFKGIKKVFNRPFFNEFCIQFEHKNVFEIIEKMKKQGILAGIPVELYYPELKNCLMIAVTEKKQIDDLYQYINVLKGIIS